MKAILRRIASSALAVATLLAGGYAAASAAEITVMGYFGPFENNYVKAVIEPFMKGHPDIKVTYFGVLNAAAPLGNLRAQKAAPQVDAVIFDLSVAKLWPRKRGFWQTSTPLGISNYADLADIGKDLGGYAMPLTYDTLTLIYNRDAFAKTPTSWEALWDADQSGKVITPPGVARIFRLCC